MATILTPIPVVGEPVSSFDRKLTDALTELQGLMSNNLNTKKNILPEYCRASSVTSGFVSSAGNWSVSIGGTSTPGSVTNVNADTVFELNPANYPSGSTPIFSFRTFCITNTIAPACTLTCNVNRTLTYNFFNANTADQVASFDPTPIVSRAYVNPAVSTVQVNTDDFTVSTPGYYMFTFNVNAVPAVNSWTLLIYMMYVRMP